MWTLTIIEAAPSPPTACTVALYSTGVWLGLYCAARPAVQSTTRGTIRIAAFMLHRIYEVAAIGTMQFRKGCQPKPRPRVRRKVGGVDGTRTRGLRRDR